MTDFLFQEDDDEDDEPEVNVKNVPAKPHAEWPQAPQFIDPTSPPATSKQVETLSTRMNQMIGEFSDGKAETRQIKPSKYFRNHGAAIAIHRRIAQ